MVLIYSKVRMTVEIGGDLMKIGKILGFATIALALLGACTSMEEQGWIRITGAVVESDGRGIKNCRLDVLDAETGKRKVGQELSVESDGKFDVDVFPGHKRVKIYSITVKCPAFKEPAEFGPFDTTAPGWKLPIDLGDIVFRRI